MSTQCCVESRPTVPLVVPYPPVEGELQPLGAPLRLDRGAVVHDRSAKRASDAREMVPRDDDDRVSPLEPRVEGPSVVAIGDPSVRGEEGSLTIPPFVPRGVDPPGLPEVAIKVDNGKACPRAEPAGEAGLAGSAGAHNSDTSHHDSLPHLGSPRPPGDGVSTAQEAVPDARAGHAE